jgi:hypothetical protein
MTSAVPTLVPIFATPFALVSIGGPADLNAALATLILSRATEEYRDPSAQHDPLCFRGREDFFEWDSEAVAQLRWEMLGGVSGTALAANCYPDAEFNALVVQARARFAIVRPNGGMPGTTAPMASWCAVYCIAAPPPTPARADSAALRLYAVRHASMFLDATNCQLRAPFSVTHYVWRPVPGQMAVFPASILHEVALNRAAEDLLLVTARVRFAHRDDQAQPPW